LIKVKIRKTNTFNILKDKWEVTKTPSRATKGSAGYDLYLPDNTDLYPGMSTLIPLSFSAKIPEGYYASVVPRSSLGLKGITVANSPATIDSDYIGQWHIALWNHTNQVVNLKEGDRIGQVIFLKCEDVEWIEVEELEETDRGSGGFGSTGK